MSNIMNVSKRKDINVHIPDVRDTHTGLSDPEDDASSGLESFDEDDMYGSDYGDNVICDSPDTDEESQELEHSLHRFENVMAESRSLCVSFENIYTLAKVLYQIRNQEYASKHNSTLGTVSNVSYSDDIRFSFIGLDRPPVPSTYFVTLKGINQMPRNCDAIVLDIVDGIEEVVIKHTKTKHGTIWTMETVVPVVRPQKECPGQPSRSRKMGTQSHPHEGNSTASRTPIHSPEDPHMHPSMDEQQYPLQDTTEDWEPHPRLQATQQAAIPPYSIGDRGSVKIRQVFQVHQET
ncbi:hypothetical protein H4582DRAFT_2063198 [Lactarius indigo]|nr:hypothetical protein H4582DRAFT_2063198 [Lactarius indigo]